MRIVEKLNQDQEIQELKKLYKEKNGKNAPPYNYDEYAGLDDYKSKLKKLVEQSNE